MSISTTDSIPETIALARCVNGDDRLVLCARKSLDGAIAILNRGMKLSR